MSLPAPKEVKDMLEDLLGRSVTVSLTDPMRESEIRRTLVSLYMDDQTRLRAVIGMNLSLSVYLGAAIGLIPAAGAQDCIQEGQFTRMIAENITEICNVMTGLLNRPNGPHVRMFQRFLPGEAPPTDATGLLVALGQRIDLIVEVANYGAGKLSISVIP